MLAACAGDKKRFYVYVLLRPNGQPCYVGKGKGVRWQHHFRYATNSHLKNIITKHGIESMSAVRTPETLTEAESHELEILLIADIGRHSEGGPLANISVGGEGASGCVRDSASRAKQSKARKEFWTEEKKAALRLRYKERYAHDPKYRERIDRAVELARADQSVTKRVASLTGRKLSQKLKDKLSASATRRHADNRSNGIVCVNGNTKKTHCVRGHELSGDNLYVPSNAMRVCRECKRLRKAEYRAKSKVQVPHAD